MNITIFYYLYSLAHRSHLLDNLIIFCAVYLPYLVTLAVLIFIIIYHKSLREVVLVLSSGIMAWITDYFLKILFHVQRPINVLPGVHSLFLETDYSFPSGHATFFFAIAFAIFFKHRKAGYVLMICALVIGIARVVAGVHFPYDILGGVCLALIISLVIYNLQKR